MQQKRKKMPLGQPYDHLHLKLYLFVTLKISYAERFLVSLMSAGNFLLYAENFLRSKFCLMKQKYAPRMKFFTLQVSMAYKYELNYRFFVKQVMQRASKIF